MGLCEVSVFIINEKGISEAVTGEKKTAFTDKRGHEFKHEPGLWTAPCRYF